VCIADDKEVDTIVVFGDSHADTEGRLYQLSLRTGVAFPPAWMFPSVATDSGRPRLSNGKLWPEFMVEALNFFIPDRTFSMKSYAHGGASLDGEKFPYTVTTEGLADPFTRVDEECMPAPPFAVESGVLQQIREWKGSDLYLTSRRRTVIVVGVSLYLSYVAGMTEDDFSRSLENIITECIQSGAPHVMISTSMDQSPLPAGIGQPTEVQEAYRASILRFTDQLEETLVQVQSLFYNVTFTMVNVNDWRHNIVDDTHFLYTPSFAAENDENSLGLSCLTECVPRYQTDTDVTTCSQPDHFLYYDLVHYTEAGHRTLGLTFAEAFLNPAGHLLPLPFFSLLLVVFILLRPCGV